MGSFYGGSLLFWDIVKIEGVHFPFSIGKLK
jgi:hypothetical protein